MTFNIDDFDQALTDIERYLGYLKGNDVAHEYLQLMWGNLIKQFEKGDGHPYTLQLGWDYKFPCPDERFKVRPAMHWQPQVLTDPAAPVDWDAYVREVRHQTDLVYQEGLTWASGLAGYLRSICERFVKINVADMQGTILNMQKSVVMELADAPNDDWARLGDLNARWTGDAAASFNEFYANYNDVIFRAARFCQLINLGSYACLNIIASAQLGVMTYVLEMRDGLVAQLDQWAHTGYKPTNPTDAQFPQWLVDLLDVADKTLALIGEYVPPVKKMQDVEGTIKNISDLVASVAKMVGAELPKAPVRVPVQTSDEIYTALTDTLTDEFLGKFETALARLNFGGSAGGSLEDKAFSGQAVLDLLKADEASGAWSVPTVGTDPLNGEGDRY